MMIANERSSSPLAVLPRLLVVAVLAASLLAAEAGVVVYARLARDLPEIPPYGDIQFSPVSVVRASHGQVLGEVFSERRYLVEAGRLPPLLINAFVASEDERFFEHEGVDLRGIARAVWINLQAGEVREGASTITQQLARSLLLTRERSVTRKAREMILARRIEDIYSKDQILVLYLNLIFLGNGAYGVQAASRVYFGKDLAELTLSEAAIIAALPQSPGRVNPASDPSEMRVRRNRVLRRMVDAGFIHAEQEAAAAAEAIVVVPSRDNLGDRAPVPAIEMMKTATQMLQKKATSQLRGETGLTVESALDLGLQFAAQNAVWDTAQRLDRRQGFRGPIAHLEPADWDAFLQRNAAWLDSRGWAEVPLNRDVLALVKATAADQAELAITPVQMGRLPLERMAWAVLYSEFPIEDAATGARTELARVSLDGRLKTVDAALKPGDVILVTRMASPVGKTVVEAPVPDTYALSQFPRVQAALLAFEPRSGYVPVMVGGTDFDLSQVNRTESLRQSGSVIKPVYYAKAYDLGIAPSTLVSGAPFREGNWTPEGDKAVDDMTIYQALTQSENNCSLRVLRMVLDRIGTEGLNDWVMRLGLSRPFSGFVAEGLGIDVKASEILSAFAAFGIDGWRPDRTLIRRIRDARGTVLLDARSPRDPAMPVQDAFVAMALEQPDVTRRATTRETAYLMQHNLNHVTEEGTARRARRLNRPVFGKTGTLPYDVWFVGWTHELAAAMWVGQDRRERYLGKTRSSGGVFGADTALPGWVDFMMQATQNRPPIDDLRKIPEGVVLVQVDPKTGEAVFGKGVGTLMPHLEGTQPLPDDAFGIKPSDEAAVAEF